MRDLSKNLERTIRVLLQDLAPRITDLALVVDFGALFFRGGGHPFNLLEPGLATALASSLECGVATIHILREGGPLEPEQTAIVASKLAALHERSVLRFEP